MLGTVGRAFLKVLGGTRNERVVRARMHLVRERINAVGRQLQEEYEQLVRRSAEAERLTPDQMLRDAMALGVAPAAAREWLTAKTHDLRRRRQQGESLERLMPEAFAVIRFASWLAQNHRQFDVQMVAGQMLFSNTIAEEATGEGKTVACYPAIFLSALDGMKVHVVTVNDYLVQRDADFARPVFALVGMKVGAIQQPMDSRERQQQYACDVLYGWNTELGFDYLRDNMKMSVADQVQGRLDYAIVDEADNILIDEARTPLIISGPAYGDVERFRRADGVARQIIQLHQPYEQASRRVDALKRGIKALQGELSKSGGAAKESVAGKLQQARDDLARAE